jgi:Protein of unknown function (DUF2563)
MEVNTEHMLDGGDSCRYAADAARKGAERLTRETVERNIFGDFDAGHQFHSAITAAHQDHIERLNGHDTALTNLSGHAKDAAHLFTNTDETGGDDIHSASRGL